MSNNSASNSNNNLYNICSLEHCFTNLFALTDITGIKWLRLRAKDKPQNPDKTSFVTKGRQKRKKSNKIDDNEDDEEDEEENDEEEDDDESNEETERASDGTWDKNMTSHLLKTTSINDPVLITHAKCLSEDILSSWKRADLPSNKNLNSSAMADENFEEVFVEDSAFKKELWIFWFEKEEPNNLRSIISNDLVVEHSNQSSHNHSNNNQSISDENILSQAASSLISLPYECRSMLFKALHNLIEKSLLEKGYARLGKWFVMPYNLNSINFSMCNQNVNSSSMFLNKDSTKTKPKLQINNQIDDTNHVSYSFSFFLHGTSRICTSVDIKMHKPIRCLNQTDLVQLRTSIQNFVQNKTKQKMRDKESVLFSQGVILAPYGLAASLIGYLPNESVESRVTCAEWRQFYPLNLNPGLPNVFVVGVDNNRVKLFYPNCFIYVVMDSDSDKSDDDDDGQDYDEEAVEAESHSEDSVDTSLSDEDRAAAGGGLSNPAKEMDNLDLTIDSVARNFGADKDKSALSVSLNSPMSVANANAVSSPAQSPANSPSLKAGLKRHKSLLNRSNPAAEPKKKRKKNLDSSSSDAAPTPLKKKSPLKRASSESENSDNDNNDDAMLASRSLVDQIHQKPDEHRHKCCLKLNKLFKNQIRLRHKKYDLFAENLSLALDVLDKAALQSCTHSDNCTCTKCSLTVRTNSGLTKCSCSLEQNSTHAHSDQLSVSGTKCVPFHKRQCYFWHKKLTSNDSYREFSKLVKSFRMSRNFVRLGKKIQFKNSNPTELRVLRVRPGTLDETSPAESDNELSGYSTDSCKTDPEMFDYQYFEREDEHAETFKSEPDSAETDSQSDADSSSSQECRSPAKPTNVKYRKQYMRNDRLLFVRTDSSLTRHKAVEPDERRLDSDGEPSFDTLYTKCEILYDEEPEVNLIAKSSQMTPPKSVESSQSSAHHHHHHNAVNVPPASYDDLNNIFEDESSADEQHPGQTSTNSNHMHQQHQHVQFINPIQTSLSVVMTPPSHENIHKSSTNGADDLMMLNDPDLLLKRTVVPTRQIVYNDLKKLLQMHNFGSMFAEQKFSMAKLETAHVSQVTKYKPVKLGVDNEILCVPTWKRSETKPKSDKCTRAEHSADLVEIAIPDKLKCDTTVKNVKLDLQIKPLDKYFSQMDMNDYLKFNLNVNNYLNSVCLNLSLSDTLLNLFRDINFDSCTLCVCTNNNIKGIDFGTYLCNDVFNTTETALLVNNNNSQSVNVPIGSSSHYVSCTCGFSSVVNRQMSARPSRAVRLSRLIRAVEKLKMESHEQNLTLPYYNIVSLLNRLTQSEYQSRQLMILDSTSFNGLFAEDYTDILMINQPHYLLWSILQENAKLTLNSTLVTKKMLNSVLLRDGYIWKKSLLATNSCSAKNTDTDKKNIKKPSINSIDEKLVLKMENKLDDVLKLNVMDLFDLKYSQPMLCTYEQCEIFYANNHVHDSHEEIFASKQKPRLKSYLNKKLDTATLDQFDDNNVCRNVIKRLDKKLELKDSKFMLHSWLYAKKEIKSNLEMTKSLKLIQPLLEETVQKKHTTSRMWESFQGPLTWQHFCRLALTGAQQKQVQAPSGASVPSSLNQNQQNNYEPEPIPALLASSTDKDWVTISPYAIKFWEKLNLEPYSRQKNLAYLVLMPEIDLVNDMDSLVEFETTKQSVKSYMKELNSMYELCRLGLHRPALRIAPDQGFVKVQNQSGIKVDEWFTKIQVNKQTRQIGKMLKQYAKTFRLLANKISQGAKSTISNTIQGSFFPSETLNNQVKNTTSFQTSQTGVPVVSQINLDRTIYEELKVTKLDTVSVQSVPQPQSGSTLSNLLSQPIGNEFSDLNNPLTIDFNSSQAQILNFKEDTKENTFVDSQTQQYQSQQQILNSISSSSNITSVSQLTQNMQSPPSLFVYIIDPFDFKLYNQLETSAKKKIKSEPDSDVDDDFLDTNDEQLTEFDLRRLRQLGLLKAYLEFYNNLPDLFKFSTQFQIIPLSLCIDLQTQSTSMYMQSLLMSKQIALSNYSSYYSAGFGTGCSDMDSDFRQSLLKSQAFNSFCLSKRYFMSPAHNMYLNLHQRQAYPNRPKIFTSFGPAASEENFLHDTLLNNGKNYKFFSDLEKIQFYSPLFVLAPSTIATTAVSLATSSLFFKNSTTNTHHNLNSTGDGVSHMPNFVHLNFSNSNYGFLNSHHTYNYNLGELIGQQQQLLPGGGSNLCSAANSNYLTYQSYHQQSNVLYVGYCLSEDQRFLLATCTDENGELIESTSINIEVDERFKRKENHSRRIGLRKLWEFIIAVISQTSKPWRLVVGRLGRLGHSELRGWACLLSKKNLQRFCHQLKENCEACNSFGNLESPFILSACLISMEKSDMICVYPESCSKEDKIAAAALTGQQSQLSNHMTQAHGVSCTHILTFPASAVIQTQSSSLGGSNLKDLDPLGKSALGAMPMEDDIFGDFFNLEEDDQLLVENMNDKGLNESGAAMDAEQGNLKEKFESLLNQEELAHLDQQPLAIGYYVSTAKCGPLPKWLRGDLPFDYNFHTFKATLHIHNRYALENDELNMKADNSHKLDSPITYEALRYVLERYNALSWLNIDPLMQDRKSCLPIHHSILLQMYFAFKNYI